MKSIHKTENGVSLASNMRIVEAIGDCVLFTGADDWIEQET